MFTQPGTRAWFWHESVKMSVDLHQTEFYRYLPAELKAADIKSKEGYIAYKRKTGFSDMSFILPPTADGRMSDVTFKTYGEPTIEGANLDIVALDELTGREATHAEIAETMPLRVAERDGIIIKPFTPVDGYSETVRMDMDGGQVVQESAAFLCPKDSGEPDTARALGLTDKELAELWTADETKPKRAAYYPQSRPEEIRDDPARMVPPGREFERVPRVVKCLDPEARKAVVFFHSSDNPYGNPKNVARTIRSRNAASWFVKERFYGVAHKLISARFVFDRTVHIVPAAEVPPPSACTNYHLGDPHSKRNMAMAWFSVTPERVYLRREWPGDYYIPGVGVPGPWAVPGRRPDGAPGPAQKPFGFGLRDYKREIARLEGWKDFRSEKPVEQSAEDWSHAVDAWDETNGAREPISERELDARFASTPRMEKDRPVTLLTEFDDIGLYFNGMPGDDIDAGLTKIDDALSYDRSRPVDFWNQPPLQISSDCTNTIYALETWTGLTQDGKTDRDGATKEWIDLLKGFFLRSRPYLGGNTAADLKETEKAFY